MRSEVLRDSLKVTKPGLDPAKTWTWTLGRLPQSCVTKVTSSGRHHDFEETTPPMVPRLRPARPRLREPQLRQGAREEAALEAAARLALLYGGSGAAGAEARSREGAGPSQGRGRARGGSGRAGPAGDGWGGRLPGAAREDVATAPGCPSAPETPPRRSPQPPCLRRPRPRSGPSPRLLSQVPAGPAAAAGEEAAAAAALGAAGRPAWGRTGRGTLGCRQSVVWAPLLCVGRGLGLSLPYRGGGKPFPGCKSPPSGQPTPVL